MAVFLPSTFLGGIVGQMYRQFALTIAATAVISTINAVTLKPAQCAVYLRPPKKPGLFARTFNRFYDRCERMYFALIPKACSLGRSHDARLCGTCGAYDLVVSIDADRISSDRRPGLPSGFGRTSARRIPAANAWSDRRIADDDCELPGVADTVIIGGRSLLDNTSSSNSATIYIILKDWSERTTSETSLLGIYNALQKMFQIIRQPKSLHSHRRRSPVWASVVVVQP